MCELHLLYDELKAAIRIKIRKFPWKNHAEHMDDKRILSDLLTGKMEGKRSPVKLRFPELEKSGKTKITEPNFERPKIDFGLERHRRRS